MKGRLITIEGGADTDKSGVSLFITRVIGRKLTT
jgi:hypothetical protein